MLGALSAAGDGAARRRVAIDRVEALGWALITVHAVVLVATGELPAWGWVVVAAVTTVSVPALVGRWVLTCPARALLLTGAASAAVLGGGHATSAAWLWLTLAVALPALHGSAAIAVVATAVLTATAATLLAATGEAWSLVTPATAAILLVGALATGMAETARDAERAVRALQAGERRFGALLRDAAEVIVLFGPDRQVQFVSPALQRVLGYADAEVLRGDWLPLVHADDRAAVVRLVARVRGLPGVAASGEFRVRHADGHHVWIDARVVDLTANPDVVGTVVSFHDISDQKDAATEERLRISRELHDSVSQSLFSMALQARAAQLELERSGFDAEAPARRAVVDVADLARGALAEIRALIFELRPRALAEEGFVSAVRKHAAAVASRHRVLISVEAPQQRVLVGDLVEEHLFRVIQEAIGNAARHAAARRIEVEIATAGAPAWVTVTVRDDGRGFDPTARFDGHFGLQTMRERVAVLGGQLRVDSAPGSGTAVMVAVPVDSPAAVAPTERRQARA